MDERLGQVATQLALTYVVLLGEESGRPAGRPGPLEPAEGPDAVAEVVRGQRHVESAQQEDALGLAEWFGAVLKAVQVPVLNQPGLERSPHTALSREWVHHRFSSSHSPASGSGRRRSTAATATRTAASASGASRS
ncbi:hypothetical protein STVIR_7685 [Streptomyces viridochromogenes Tue57]|uniref:Uncharacterized protein n=1 Tax=Streptomyces viridochromogenes Tue57 TaxID=1160705 RepID=L8P5B0_STRVR|nr:hypothetical protein STVIR_7685 [Streptomyces viridochromogenes Tue57]